MAGEIGNNFSNKNNRMWRNTLNRIAAQDPERLRRIAEALYLKAEEGDMNAIREIGDRLDGKAAQVIAGDEDNPLQVVNKVVREIVKG